MSSSTDNLRPIPVGQTPLPSTDARGSEGRYKRNIVRIATGTTASQALALAAMPLLTRLFGPEEFGALAVFTAVHSAIACVFTLKYELAIILPAKDPEASDLTVLTVVLSIGLSLLLLVSLLAANFVAGVDLAWPYYLLPLSAVVAALYTSTQQWVARAADYRWYAGAQFVNSVANVATACLIWIVAGALSGSLIVAYVAGLAAAAIVLLWAVLRGRDRGTPHSLPRPAVLLDTARRYKRFPFYVLPTWFMATLGMSAHPFVLQLLFDLREVGQYAIASRFLLVPGALIGGAVSEAFRSEFVDRLKRGVEVTGLFKRTLIRLSLFALPVFLVFFVLAPTLFGWAFGEEYRHSGVLSRYLCLGVLAQFISQPFSAVFVATGYVRRGLVVQAALTGLPIAGLVIGGSTGDMERAVLLAAVLAAASATGMTALAYRCCVRAERANGQGAHG